MANVVESQEICDLLQIVIKDKLENYLVTLHEGNKRGEGYLSDLIILSLQKKGNKENIHLVIKQSISKTEIVTVSFEKEIYFYEVVWPTLKSFQRKASSLQVLDLVPKCWGTDFQSEVKKIVLDNLKFFNYELYDKTKPFDKVHMELIFNTYGKFHGLSYALKTKDFKKYSDMVKPVEISWDVFLNLSLVPKFVTTVVKNVMKNYNGLKQDEVLKKMEVYAEKGNEIFLRSAVYEGNYSTILHGDCWSNNMMFTYDQSRIPVDMKLLDIQMVRTGTPVYDLSYSFYAGASKEILDELDHYLKVYHTSLSNILQAFNCDPEVVYPFSTLKQEWKQYCQYGFLLGLMAWGIKLIKDESGPAPFEERQDANDLAKPVKFDEELHKMITSNILLHMHENDFL